ncbi:probable kinetochore protein SPC25 [Carica papaya]|uniref:probable kinetochore protein SPC25 n=1 Tax=Carica papaya TaxID=3649 RepID=UPI000B8CA164|nr:probable kinetochore protein SPC25 [Carica papaya]
MSQESLALAALEEKASQDIENKADAQDCILWYNRVLGLQIEGGHGVRFNFTDINPQNPKEEYFFTVRHANDTYTLLDCAPHVNDIKELIQELNGTNGLFRFVRIMREKFQEVAEHGIQPQTRTTQQDVSTISLSAPVLSVSSDKSTSPAERSECQIPCEPNKQLKIVNRGRGATSAILSPGSISSLQQSPRFKLDIFDPTKS